MRSRSIFGWLVRKEWRELMASRSWWMTLLLIGPLVGVSFISAVRTYGELSGVNGTAAGVGEAFSPLTGIWGPTFSACELAAAFLFPFVVIRLVAADRQSGALQIELQQPYPAAGRILAKALVLLAAWLIASAAPLVSIIVWRAYGGDLYPPEIASVFGGHLLNAGLAIALASAAATLTEHPSTAAIVTLGVTVGAWVLSFVAAVHGGVWDQLAHYTPAAMIAEFQHGLIRLQVVLAALIFISAGLGTAAIWTRLGVPVRRRVLESALLIVLAITSLWMSAFARPSWDLSEARMNSFTRPEERLLASLEEPLRMEAHLAPADPRRSDLERHAVTKLRRTVPDFDITYVSATSTGLFEQTRDDYGEIRYRLGARERVSRATTLNGVLDEIHALTGLAPEGEEDDDEVFRGHPLAVTPTGAAVVFYAMWPAAVVGAAMMSRRRGS